VDIQRQAAGTAGPAGCHRVLLQALHCGEGFAAPPTDPPESPECRVMCFFTWDFRTNALLHTYRLGAPSGAALW
jgi:hypothetical protein